MRLTAVKLAGFKSFVDPTTFRAPSNLTGIVGPNGCGKSNIIDAVRWVMGEGSARVLRGELMSDVIFSGSSTRKPVGTATVELLFDNSDGKAGGEFADYSEISIKRQVSRDGVSNYYLNGTRCRRKDVRDLFLGTGAGSSGYSIIEQGMISQLVEARPEDIRGHLEEAAGISRYKERRRETERRIGHTRDNLDRLSDVREEVENHLSRLQRQARAAERYKTLKAEQRELQARLLALQWREEMQQAEAGRAGLNERETALQEQLSHQRAAEAALEKLHQTQADANEALGEVQGELYEVASEIARLEQKIQHNREMQEQQRKEFDEVSGSLKDLEQHMLLDQAQVSELAGRLAENEPALAAAESEETAAEVEMQAAETEVQQWQEQLEQHHGSFNAVNRQAETLRASIEVLDQRMATATTRLEALAGEGKTVVSSELLDEVKRLEQDSIAAARDEAARLDALKKARQALADVNDELRAGVQAEREQQRELLAREGRLEALRALQNVSEGGDSGSQWLAGQGLDSQPLLVNSLKVDKGWETALETILGALLEARTGGDLATHAAALAGLSDGNVGLVDAAAGKVRARNGTLAEKVQGPDAIIAMLNHVRVADSIEEALAYLPLENQEQSAITRAGEWVGAGWVRVARGASGQAGMLARQQEIIALEAEIKTLGGHLHTLEAVNEKLREGLPEREHEIAGLQSAANEAHRQHSQLESQLSALRQRIGDLDRRAGQIQAESAQLREQQQADEQAVRTARGELDKVLDSMAGAEAVRAELDTRRASLLQRRDSARSRLGAARKARTELAMQTSASRASLDSLEQSLKRMDSQVSQLQQRFITLSEIKARAKDPQQEFRAEMDQLLERRVGVEQRQGEARALVQQLEEQYREQDGARQKAVQQYEVLRSELERARLTQQEIELNARGFARQAEAIGADVKALAEGLPEEAEAEQWLADIERLELRITRLEPVNLAAISEYEEELKRKEYLDAQFADLNEALETLEAAIAKIDRKTRTRFKDTFEMVNKGMQELFPRLFGGGHGYLELTGEDLLTTGVSIMARPPGKRVSSIHLLSGGEKALTAVSLIFAIFRLNPAPFCLLDEVDAPLDDANVSRFSELVKEMSASVQFIVVTHNKVTMEMVNQLSGVTMREPGVSRLVQVDIDEAARLVEA
jgi:chromosome segregation protein